MKIILFDIFTTIPLYILYFCGFIPFIGGFAILAENKILDIRKNIIRKGK